MKQHTLSLALTLALAYGGLSGSLLAADPPPAGPGMGPGPGPGMGMGPGRGMGMGRNMPTFGEFDLNGDGTLTESEFYEARTKRMTERAAQGFPMRNAARAPDFGTFDTNADGKVTPEEFAAGQAAHRTEMLTPR